MKNSSGSYYIGVDSGGTKFELLIASKDKKIIFSKLYKGIHYSISGTDVYSEIVTDFIDDSLLSSNLKLKDCLGICFGVAGAREKKDRQNLKNAFVKKLSLRNILITTDAMTALYGAFEGSDGIILISGTGSVLYGYSGGIITRVGGWGRIIGDEGSGYWIGKRALNLVTKEYDESILRKKKSLLSQKLEKEFGINKLNINEKVFQKDFEIQTIAPIVIQCAMRKCYLGKQVIDEATAGLLEHIKSFIKISKRKKPISISFIGSIIENKNIVSDKLKSEISKHKIVKVVPKKNSSAYGAVLLSAENPEITRKL